MVLLLLAEQHWLLCCVNAEPKLSELCHILLYHMNIVACPVSGQESLHCAPSISQQIKNLLQSLFIFILQLFSWLFPDDRWDFNCDCVTISFLFS